MNESNDETIAHGAYRPTEDEVRRALDTFSQVLGPLHAEIIEIFFQTYNGTSDSLDGAIAFARARMEEAKASWDARIVRHTADLKERAAAVEGQEDQARVVFQKIAGNSDVASSDWEVIKRVFPISEFDHEVEDWLVRLRTRPGIAQRVLGALDLVIVRKPADVADFLTAAERGEEAAEIASRLLSRYWAESRAQSAPAPASPRSSLSVP